MGKLKTPIAMLIVWFVMAVSHYNTVHKYETKIAELNAEILKSKDQGMMTVTAYTVSKSECDSTPNQTATMSKPVPGQTIAVSRDKTHMLGRKVYIQNVGVYYVNDLMNQRFRNSIDICIGSKEEAQRFGVKQRKVVVL